MRWYSHVFFLGGLLLIIGLLLGIVRWQATGSSQPQSYGNLRACTGHLQSNIHYHTQLEIYYQEQLYEIPEGIGINGDCIHPVHTHDTTGLVHVDFPKAYPFTLEDFFTTWGIIFNKQQLGTFHSYDGYTIDFYVNGQLNHDYQSHVLLDGERLKIVITK